MDVKVNRKKFTSSDEVVHMMSNALRDLRRASKILPSEAKSEHNPFSSVQFSWHATEVTSRVKRASTVLMVAFTKNGIYLFECCILGVIPGLPATVSAANERQRKNTPLTNRRND